MDNQENTAQHKALPSWKQEIVKELETAKNEKVLQPITFKKQMFLFFGRIVLMVALFLYAGDIDWLKWIYVIGGLTTVTSLAMYFMAKHFVQKKITKLEAQLAEQTS